MILKTVAIFSRIPEECLGLMASRLKESFVEKGENIMQKGDIGTSMFIIIDGEVNVHDGDRILSTLGARSVFGELAALDPEPRSASVTANTKTHLFEINREALYNFMWEHVEVAQGIIHVLCQRLRAKNPE